MEAKDSQVLASQQLYEGIPPLSICPLHTPLKATAYVLLQIERSSAFLRTTLGKGKIAAEGMDIKRG